MGLFNRGKVWFSANRNTYIEEGTEGFDMYKDVSGVPTQIGSMGDFYAAVADTASVTLTAATSGKTHVIPDLAQTTTVTLPAAKAGLEYVFIGSAVAGEASNWVFVSPDTVSDFNGGVQWADTTGDTVGEVYGGASDDTMTVVTPLAGTRVHFVCDGTDWCINGTVVSLTIPTIA